MQDLLCSVKVQGFEHDGSSTLEEKVYSDFAGALKDIGKIKSLELLPSGEDENIRPIVEQDGHIGVKKWALRLIFKHAYTKLFAPGRKEDKDCLTRCVVLCCPDCTTAWNIRKKCFPEVADFLTCNEELSLTHLALQLHPKSSETFSHRRWIVEKLVEKYICKILNTIDAKELYKKRPKPEVQSEGVPPTSEELNVIESSGVTNFAGSNNVASGEFCSPPREVTLGIALSDKDLFGSLCNELGNLLDVILKEFSVCKMAGEKQKCNYNAWAHRAWTMNKAISCAKHCHRLHAVMSKERTYHKTEKIFLNSVFETVHQVFSNFFYQDWKDLTAFSEKHISDISVLNAVLNCQLCITELAFIALKIYGSEEGPKHILENVWKTWHESIEQNSALLEFYGAHEALWCHRRNIMIAFRKKVAVHLNETGSFSSVITSFSPESEAQFCTEYADRHARSVEDPQRILCDRHLRFCNKLTT